MEDTDVVDGDGFPVQAYTIHIEKPIYPEKDKTKAENIEMIMNKNSQVWKEIYEKTYKIPLEYTCDK